jgi:hypothetical protein
MGIADPSLHLLQDNSFDLVWACESGEHMPDKKAYVEVGTEDPSPLPFPFPPLSLPPRVLPSFIFHLP